eukprot:2435958-Rhodomonas_salina.1
MLPGELAVHVPVLSCTLDPGASGLRSTRVPGGTRVQCCTRALISCTRVPVSWSYCQIGTGFYLDYALVMPKTNTVVTVMKGLGVEMVEP